MSVLEDYRKTYMTTEERAKRHRFEWTVKKTESSEEEPLFPPVIGLYLSGSHHIHQAAAKDLIEVIELWLNSPKEFIPEHNPIKPSRLWWLLYGW